MSYVAGDLPQALHQRLHTVKHLVEIGGEAIQFVIRPARRHAVREPTVNNGPARPVDRVDTPKEANAERTTPQGSEQNRHADSPCEGADDRFLDLDNAIGVFTNQ